MHIAVFVPTLGGGGAERVMINLSNNLVYNDYQVDLITGTGYSPYLGEIDPLVNKIIFNKSKTITQLPLLIKYLKTKKPNLLFTTQNHVNVLSLLIKYILPQQKIIIREANNPIQYYKFKKSPKIVLTRVLSKLLYKKADGIVALSEGMKDSMISFYKLPQNKIDVIYNPIISDKIYHLAKEKIDDSWINTNKNKLFLSVSNIKPQKDLLNLLKAFLIVKGKENNCKLAILGKYYSHDKYYQQLKNFIIENQLTESVKFLGFKKNPFNYMKVANVFVLSSLYEGLPGSLIQALCLGCKIVSTDCPSGPREVLDNGKYGHLVPVGNQNLLADAMHKSLSIEKNITLKEDSHLAKFKESTSTQKHISLFNKYAKI